MTTVKLSLQWDIPTLIYVTVKPSPYDRARLLIAVDRGTVLDKGQQMPRKAAIRKISSLIGDLFGDPGTAGEDRGRGAPMREVHPRPG
ncbi:hypothetical protein HPB48_009270 [Haemaphysalis longicornis]|uniref:Uncharacterized protein n=1 Tax=Haemaphysalis longicornis TaxID=44386 RepID=A0A9J6GEN2_HAELO|nr:hypothetical protein HPB48_009270 [Haemaphysalis longicornis]